MSAAVGIVVHAVKSETMFGRPKKARCGYRFPKRTKTTSATVTCRKCIRKS